jgi:hypothetical protein
VERTFFTKDEARNEIGNSIEALSDFPSVPKGTRGTVVRANQYAQDKWVVLVEWDLPVETHIIEATIVDVSLNFYKRSKPVTDQFSKTEYERLVRILQSVAK